MFTSGSSLRLRPFARAGAGPTLGLLLLVGCTVDQTGIAGAGGAGGGAGPALGRPDAGVKPGLPMDAGLAVDGKVSPASIDAPSRPADGAPDLGAPPPADASVTPGASDVGPEVVPGTEPDPCPDEPALVLCLTFEGNIDDRSGNALPVTSAGPVAYAAGPAGQALDSRPGQQLSIAETPVLDSPVLTIQATVRPRALGRRMGIVDNSGQYGLFILPSGSAMCTGGGGYALLNDAVAAGRWTQLTCVYDGAQVALFVDGRRAADNPITPLTTDRDQGLRIGWESTPARELDGLLADLRIWRVARPPGQFDPAPP